MNLGFRGATVNPCGAVETMTWDLRLGICAIRHQMCRGREERAGGIKTMDDGQARDPDKNRKDARAERLKLALRENLKRRKAQARQRKPGEATSSDLHDAAFAKDDGERDA